MPSFFANLQRSSFSVCARASVAVATFAGGTLVAAEPGGAAPNEKVIEIGTLHGKMRYDVEQFQVEPGAKVKLVFKNTDEMQHNVVICRPVKGVTLAVAQKAWALGTEAVKRQYIPDDPNVLFHTRVVNPQQTDTIVFEAPKQEGEYPYVCTLPGHAFLMKGIMRVGNTAVGLRDVEFTLYEGTWSKLPDFAALTPKKKAKAPSNVIDLAVSPKRDHYAVVWDGTLDVPQDGEYAFFLNSDDGSRVLIDNQPVVNFDGIHAAATDQTGTIKLSKGSHVFRVEYFEFQGGESLKVEWSGPTLSRVALSAGSSTSATNHKHHLHVADQPMVIRAFVEGGPARAISVGLPGNISYCFNAESGGVDFAWTGGFLDVSPDRGSDENGRGGGWCKVLGERFGVGTKGFPLRFADPEKAPQVKFQGYRRGPVPVFLMDADGVKVTQAIGPAPEGSGLQYVFTLDRPPGDVYFVAEPGSLQLSSSAGTWTGGTLKVPAAAAQNFTVTVRKP